jgi:hypothetical protein
MLKSQTLELELPVFLDLRYFVLDPLTLFFYLLAFPLFLEVHALIDQDRPFLKLLI